MEAKKKGRKKYGVVAALFTNFFRPTRLSSLLCFRSVPAESQDSDSMITVDDTDANNSINPNLPSPPRESFYTERTSTSAISTVSREPSKSPVRFSLSENLRLIETQGALASTDKASCKSSLNEDSAQARERSVISPLFARLMGMEIDVLRHEDQANKPPYVCVEEKSKPLGTLKSMGKADSEPKECEISTTASTPRITFKSLIIKEDREEALSNLPNTGKMVQKPPMVTSNYKVFGSPSPPSSPCSSPTRRRAPSPKHPLEAAPWKQKSNVSPCSSAPTSPNISAQDVEHMKKILKFQRLGSWKDEVNYEVEQYGKDAGKASPDHVRSFEEVIVFPERADLRSDSKALDSSCKKSSLSMEIKPAGLLSNKPKSESGKIAGRIKGKVPRQAGNSSRSVASSSSISTSRPAFVLTSNQKTKTAKNVSFKEGNTVSLKAPATSQSRKTSPRTKQDINKKSSSNSVRPMKKTNDRIPSKAVLSAKEQKEVETQRSPINPVENEVLIPVKQKTDVETSITQVISLGSSSFMETKKKISEVDADETSLEKDNHNTLRKGTLHRVSEDIFEKRDSVITESAMFHKDTGDEEQDYKEIHFTQRTNDVDQETENKLLEKYEHKDEDEGPNILSNELQEDLIQSEVLHRAGLLKESNPYTFIEDHVSDQDISTDVDESSNFTYTTCTDDEEFGQLDLIDCYLEDLLLVSGLHAEGEEVMFIQNDVVLDPGLFNVLEEKYSISCWPKHERKAIFDFANEILCTMLRPYALNKWSPSANKFKQTLACGTHLVVEVWAEIKKLSAHYKSSKILEPIVESLVAKDMEKSPWHYSKYNGLQGIPYEIGLNVVAAGCMIEDLILKDLVDELVKEDIDDAHKRIEIKPCASQ